MDRVDNIPNALTGDKTHDRQKWNGYERLDEENRRKT